LTWDPVISPILGTTPDPLVKTIKYVDPLILDLDGDGLEITPLSKGILFDANGDNIKTGSAWAGADDGILVRDLNGNGKIDSGAELFGDETLLENGQKAAHGFAALAELDRGNVADGLIVGVDDLAGGAGDGVFDIKDAQYANLRIWRDLNQDGISQSEELQTLADSGIASINLTSTASTQSYGDALLVQNGSFTHTRGDTGQAGSFVLAQNNFVRSFTPIAVSEAAQALPNIEGAGWVRDLQEAATQSPELIALINQAKEAPTRADYKAAVATLMREWGNDSAYNNASKQALAAGYGLIMSDPQDDQERGWMDVAIKADEADRETFRATLSGAERTKFDAMRERMVGGLEQVYAYEAFTGYSFLSWAQVRGDALSWNPRPFSNGTGTVPAEVWVPLSQIMYEHRNAVVSSENGYIRVTIATPPSGMPHVETLWNRLVDDASTNLLLPLRLSKYFDLVDLNITDSEIAFDVSRLNASFLTAATDTTAALNAVADLIDLQKYATETVQAIEWSPYETLLDVLETATITPEIQTLLIAEHIVALGVTDTDYRVVDTAGWTVLGNADANSLTGGNGNDALYGMAGDDTLNGGAGNDLLVGGAGSDTYVFNVRDGNDSILETKETPSTGARQAQDINTLQFGPGITVGDINLAQEDDALVFHHMNGRDSVTVAHWFAQEGGNAKLDTLTFADGRSFDLNTLQLGSANADVLTALATAGGIPLNQLLAGAAGNDTLTGGDGNDWLLGGTDADTLSGGAGNDTYSVDNAGDVVIENSGDGVDVVEASISYTLTDNVENLTLVGTGAIAGTGNVLDNLISGNTGNNHLQGLGGNDTLIGQAGNDTLDGGLGADVMTGGTGSDTYVVDTQADTVIEQIGEGTDTVQTELNYTLGRNLENLTLTGTNSVDGTGNELDNVLTGNSANNTLTGLAGKDTLDGGLGADTLLGGLGDDLYLVDNSGDNVIEAAEEGHDLVQSSINYTLTDHVENLTLTGTTALDGSGNALDNTLTGNGAANTLSGLAGNDTLDGGAGADTLLGGTGSDTYVVDNTGDVVLRR